MFKDLVKLLMTRDGLTKEEAVALISETREMIYDCNGNIVEAEEIMLDQLGLEIDYIVDIL